MADELTINWRATFTKSGTDITFPDPAKREFKVTITGTRFILNRQSIGTSAEAIVLGEVVTGGYFFAVNRDATNFVEIRPGAGLTDTIRLQAGEGCMFRISPDAAAPQAIADTDAVELEYLLVEA